MSSYSQYGEDTVIAKVFSGHEKGFYIDVGANHPIWGSNTYMFCKSGWSGICIDPHKAFASEYSTIRPRDIFLPVVISCVEGEVEFFVTEGKEGLSPLGPKLGE